MSVHAKLLEAQKSVEAVVKRGKNTQQKYDYAMASDVVGVCRKALHDAGLASAVTKVEDVEQREVSSKSGTGGVYAQVKVTLHVFDAEGHGGPDENFIRQQIFAFEGVGAGIDYPGDKAIYKAQTGATKYAYANALALPFADHDPEKDVPGEAGRVPVAKPEPTDLPDEKVDEVGKAVKDAGVGFDRLCQLLTAVGADAPKIKRRDSIRKALASLTEEQAENVLNKLDVEKAKVEQGG